MSPDLLRSAYLASIGILVFVFIHGILKWLDNRAEYKRENAKYKNNLEQWLKDRITLLESHNRELEEVNDQLRQDIKRLMYRELEHLEERKVVNKRLRMLANEVRADDNSKLTRVFKPLDLQEKLRMTNKTMNLAICHECLNGRPGNCSGECDGA